MDLWLSSLSPDITRPYNLLQYMLRNFICEKSRRPSPKLSKTQQLILIYTEVNIYKTYGLINAQGIYLILGSKRRRVIDRRHLIERGVYFNNCNRLNKTNMLSARIKYRKIPKISPRAYIFQRPFLRGLFLEWLIFGGAYLQREICVSKSIGLAL